MDCRDISLRFVMVELRAVRAGALRAGSCEGGKLSGPGAVRAGNWNLETTLEALRAECYDGREL